MAILNTVTNGEVLHLYHEQQNRFNHFCGVTNNLVNRVAEHRTRDNKSFTSRYNCHKLVYYEEYSSILEAIAREKQIKSWNRGRKERMIDDMNPERVDLLPEIATSLRSSQ